MPIEIQASCYDELHLGDIAAEFEVSTRTADGVKYTPRDPDENEVPPDMVAVKTTAGMPMSPTSPGGMTSPPMSPKSPMSPSSVMSQKTTHGTMMFRKSQTRTAVEKRAEAMHVKRGPKKRQRKHPPYRPQGTMESVLNLQAVKVKTDKDTGATTATRIERKSRRKLGGKGGDEDGGGGGGGGGGGAGVAFASGPGQYDGFQVVGESQHGLYVNALREEAKQAKASVLKDRKGFELMMAHISRAERRVKTLQTGHNLDAELVQHTPVEVGLWVQKYAAQIERSPVMTMCIVHGVTPPASLVARERERERREGGPAAKADKGTRDDGGGGGGGGGGGDDDGGDDNESLDTVAKLRKKKEKERAAKRPLAERLDSAVHHARRERLRGDGNSSRLSNSSRGSSRAGGGIRRTSFNRAAAAVAKMVNGKAMPPPFRRPSNVGGRAAAVAAANASNKDAGGEVRGAEGTGGGGGGGGGGEGGAGGGGGDGPWDGSADGPPASDERDGDAAGRSSAAPMSAAELMHEMVVTRDGTYTKMRGLCARVHGFRRGRLMNDAQLQKNLEVKEFGWAKEMKLRNDSYDGPGGALFGENDDESGALDAVRKVQTPKFWQSSAAKTISQMVKTASDTVAREQKDSAHRNRWFKEALTKAVESATSATYPPLVHFLFAIHYVLVVEGAPFTEELFFAVLKEAFDSDDYKGAVLKVVRTLCEKLGVTMERLVRWMKAAGLKPSQQLTYQATGSRRNTSHAASGAGVSTASSLEAFRAKRFGGNAGGPGGGGGANSRGLAAMQEGDEDEDDDDDDDDDDEE